MKLRVWRVPLGAAVIALVLAVMALVPRLRERWSRAPLTEGGALSQPIEIDLCADRRPDGTLPAACAAGPLAREATLLFAGDTAEVDAALPTLFRDGIDHPFGATAELVRAADLAVANLEAPISDVDSPPGTVPWKRYRYRAAPESARALARAGFDLVSLANNHAMDHGTPGLVATLMYLGEAGVHALGAGASLAAARRPVVVKIGALRVGLVARCERKLGWDLYEGLFAAEARAGVAPLDGAGLAADLASLRPRVDVLVLLVHWGDDYAPPTDVEQSYARAAANAGADLVVGTHPHVAQPVVFVGRTAVAQSLGNYAFGTPGRADLDLGLLLRVRVREGRVVALELIPLDVQNRRVDFRPVPLHGEHAARTLATIGLVPDGDGGIAVLKPTAGAEPERTAP